MGATYPLEALRRPDDTSFSSRACVITAGYHLQACCAADRQVRGLCRFRSGMLSAGQEVQRLVCVSMLVDCDYGVTTCCFGSGVVGFMMYMSAQCSAITDTAQ
jgi:hypothetical protein